MLNLIRYDLFKMVKSRKLYFFYAFAFLTTFISPIAKCCVRYPGIPPTPLLENLSAERFSIIMVPVFTVLFCSEDFSSGYIKNVFSSLNKLSYVLSKLICVFLFFIAYELIAALDFFILSYAFEYEFLKTPVLHSGSIYTWLEIVYKFFVAMEYGAIAVMLSVIFRKTKGIPAVLIVLFYQVVFSNEVINILYEIFTAGGALELLVPAASGIRPSALASYFDSYEFNKYIIRSMDMGKLLSFLFTPVTVSVSVITISVMASTIILSERKI